VFWKVKKKRKAIKKRKERNTTACVISGRASHAPDAPTLSFFCFGSHLPVHRLCISFSKFKTKKRDLPNPDRLQLRKFWSPRQSYHTKGRQDLERERVCVCVVTCSFVFLCSYNQFVSFSGKKKQKRRNKQKGKQKGGYLIWAHHAGRLGVRPCCSLFFTFVFFLFPIPLLNFCTLFPAALITCLAL